MKVGDTVYWLSAGNDRICSGPILLMSEKTNHEGKPIGVVVGFDGEFHSRNIGWGHSEFFATKAEAYRVGQQRLTKTIAAANQAMLSLVDSLHADESKVGVA